VFNIATDNYRECKLYDETTRADICDDEEEGERPSKKKSFGKGYVSCMAGKLC
jgi:hypothetical protein